MESKVGVVMGSISDWNTMKLTTSILDEFSIPYTKDVVSAHRMPNELTEYGLNAAKKGYQVLIAGAGGAAHLPGMLAAQTTLPVIGVPIQTKALNGVDSLLSIVQMPAGIPVATTAIGSAGAKNAALLAVEILALNDIELKEQLIAYRQKQHKQSVESGELFE